MPSNFSLPDLFTEQRIELPEETLRAMKAKLDAMKALYADLPRRIAEDEQRYKAALLFAPKDFNPEEPSGHQPTSSAPALRKEEPLAHAASGEDRQSWPAALRLVLAGESRGLSHQEALAMCMRVMPELTRSNGDKGFYNAIARLSERGEIVKHAGRLYARGIYDNLDLVGDLPPDEPAMAIGGDSGALVLRILRDKAMSGPELKMVLSSRADATKSLREHDSYMYGILDKLMKARLITKENGVYRAKGDADGKK